MWYCHYTVLNLYLQGWCRKKSLHLLLWYDAITSVALEECVTPGIILTQHTLSAVKCADFVAGIGMDACITPIRHGGLSLVQSTSFFYVLVDDPYMMVKYFCSSYTVLSNIFLNSASLHVRVISDLITVWCDNNNGNFLVKYLISMLWYNG